MVTLGDAWNTLYKDFLNFFMPFWHMPRRLSRLLFKFSASDKYLPPMLQNLCQMPESKQPHNNHATEWKILSLGIWYHAAWLNFVMFQRNLLPPSSVLKGFMFWKHHISMLPLTSSKLLHKCFCPYVTMFKSADKKLCCIVLNYSVPVSYSTMNICSLPLYSMLLQCIAEVCTCCCQLLLTGGINVQPITFFKYHYSCCKFFPVFKGLHLQIFI